ncbi:RagB/SusD family nutrient uptake outer membrane protein [Nitritalea halalkaliphila]|uniref:RagB/SusD family nutrient uptake outer membrane protein n=1 Tax=Nitritalea halalkaliphila TaxID=590849 RepID=UPI0006822A5D|nr:RagB/SusD family nutrient uptake outer membrane protein [Nitritalea halalkaliphila]
MKIHTKISFWGLVVAVWMTVLPACQTDFTNPNAPTDAQVLSSRDGLLNLAVGVRVLYATSGVRFMVENNAVTAREAAITTTFINMIELEDGGDALTDFNTNVEGLWASMLRVMGACEDIVAAVDEVELLASTRNNLRAYANIFRAMAIGALAQNYAEVVIQTNRQNEASFVSRGEAYAEAIRLLEAALADLQGDPSPEVAAILQGNLNLQDIANAYLARFRLFNGNYEGAIQAAAQVSPQRTSVFTYDQLNQNPIWARVIQNNVPNFRPIDHFGLPEGLRPEANDGRRAFYLAPSEDININGFPIEGLRGFFENDNSPIPVYLPGEMALITG